MKMLYRGFYIDGDWAGSIIYVANSGEDAYVAFQRALESKHDNLDGIEYDRRSIQPINSAYDHKTAKTYRIKLVKL